MNTRLETILKQVSRSFYLSLKVLPGAVRPQIGLAYLIARAADTIADTDLLPAGERREILSGLRQAITAGDAQGEGPPPLRGLGGPGGAADADAEARLLAHLPECLALLRQLDAEDGRLVRRVLSQLLLGMDRDLERFPAARPGVLVPPGEVVALRTLHELDDYTYYAAGCVGEFWTEITAAHLPEMAEVAHLRGEELMRRGVWLGKALQLVNVLRDAPADLRAGRCYWPEEILVPHGLTPEALARLAGGVQASPGQREAVLAVTGRLHRMARELIEVAWPYVQAIPPRAVRLRLACTWPLLLGLDTLAALSAQGSPLLCPGHSVKVGRGRVYAMVAQSAGAALCDRVTRRGTGGLLDMLQAGHAIAAS